MANGFVQVPPDSTGKKMQTFENSVGGNTVEAEAVALVDTTGASILGTAGTPSADVLSIQGVSGGTTIPVTGTITAVTAITNPLPAGTNVIGHVITDSGSVAAVSGAGASGSAVSGNPVLTAGTDGTNARTLLTDTAGNQLTGRSSGANSALAAWTSATTINTAAAVLTNNGEYDSVIITLNQTTTITAGAITFQVSEDGTNWLNVLPNTSPTATQNGVYTFVPSTYAAFHFGISGYRYFQVVLSTAIVGSGTVTVGYNLQAGTLGKRSPVSVSKVTTIETTTLLLANAVYTGPWHDSQADGTMFVSISSFSNIAGTVALQASNDFTNTNLNHQSFIASATASQLNLFGVPLAERYWRVVYTNGGTNQASFELAVTSSNTPPEPYLIATGTPGLIVFPGGATTTPGDNQSQIVSFASTALGFNALAVASEVFGGSFSGSASATLSGWSKARTSTVFKTASVSAATTGNSAIWTPGTGNKFRLLGFQITAQGLAATATGVVTVSFQDATTGINIGTYDVDVPAVATVVSGTDQISGAWVSLGSFGVLSAAANNVLNFNISAAGAGTVGTYRVTVAGTEE